MELLWGEAFFAGALAQLVARLTSLPSVVLLLATGLLIGRAGLDLVQPETLGRGLEPLVGLLVSLVLFDGGLNLRLAGRDLQRAVVQLVLVRGVLGLLGGAWLAHQLAGLPWPLAWVQPWWSSMAWRLRRRREACQQKTCRQDGCRHHPRPGCCRPVRRCCQPWRRPCPATPRR